MSLFRFVFQRFKLDNLYRIFIQIKTCVVGAQAVLYKPINDFIGLTEVKFIYFG